MRNECKFCIFTDKEVLVYEDDVCYSVISREPINKHHLMVIPKEHYKNLVDIPDDVISHLFQITKKISGALRKAVKLQAITHITDDDVSDSGYNLVEHFKIHIIPRLKDEKIKIEWNRENDPGLEVRAKYAEDIKSQL